MSIAVAIEDLPAAIARQIGWCYLLTVSDAGQARILAVAPNRHGDGTMQFDVGRGTAANAAARPNVTLVYPPLTADAMSLVVDGTATVDGTSVRFTPLTAVMHRSAIPTGEA